MKTQSSFKQYGFTIVELMVTISIIAIITASMLSFNTNPQQHLTRADRLATRIASNLHDALSFIQIGRMDNNTPPEAVTGAVLTFSTGTGGRMTNFYNASLSGLFQAPYYDNDFNYQIDSITWTGGINTPSGSLNFLEINITNGNITFSGAGIDSTAPIVTFSSRYITRSKKVIFDRRTGRVEVNKE